MDSDHVHACAGGSRSCHPSGAKPIVERPPPFHPCRAHVDMPLFQCFPGAEGSTSVPRLRVAPGSYGPTTTMRRPWRLIAGTLVVGSWRAIFGTLIPLKSRAI